MKAAAFEYVRPRSVAEVCAILASDPDAAILAGGQTLVPMMAMRLARPSCLIDIARIPELRGIRDDGTAVAVGAATRQSTAEKDERIARKVPLLAAALPWVGHAATRNRGTIGGSVANADPAAEIPLILMTLKGSVMLRDSAGLGTVGADDFFVGPMMTSMATGSCITEVRFPAWHEGRIGVGFQEISARRSDFALVSAAAQVALDESGRCTACTVGIGGATAVPRRLDAIGDALIGSLLSDAEVRDAVRAEAASLDIMSSPHASDDYRRRVAATLGARALAQARDDALHHAGHLQ